MLHFTKNKNKNKKRFKFSHTTHYDYQSLRSLPASLTPNVYFLKKLNFKLMWQREIK